LFFISGLSSAQSVIERGTFSINGNISFTSNQEETSDLNSTLFIFNPRFDYFIIDNLSLGLSLNYQHSSFSNFSSSRKGIGPSLRYYFNMPAVKPFLGVGYAYADDNTSIIYNNMIMNAGVDYFLTDDVAIETILSYTISNVKYPQDYEMFYSDLKTTRKSLSIGLGINIFLR
jgi:outer membrane protein